MNTYKNLPLLEMEFESGTEEGVSCIALVDKPAIQRPFLAFREAAVKAMQFAVTSEDRHIVSGPLMLADTPIYRAPPQVPEECYVTVSADVIERVAQNFFALGYQRNVNLEHDPEKQVEGVVMFESFINDSSRGIAAPKGYEDAPQGSWFGSFRVDNPEVWQQVKSGEFSGFSVEGFFRLLKAPDPYETLLRQVEEILKNTE